MSKSCTILAYVRNSKGEMVESKLFKDLLHYTSNNRQIAKEYYAVGTNEEFLSKVRDNEDYKVDENGEITFDSLRKLSKMDLESDKLIQVLNRDIGEGEYDYSEAIRRVENFNNNNTFSDKVMATLVPIAKGKYYISVVPVRKTVETEKGKKVEENTVNEQKKLHDVVRNQELENKLISLLRSHGVSVKFLENDNEGGRYSTENVGNMENALYGLIEVNESGHTTDVLTEEAGHFAIGALGDNPLVQRLQKVLESPQAQEEALGSEDYNNAQLGDNPAREAAGRLVGKALQRKLDKANVARVLANRIANVAKRLFYGITGNEVRWAAAKAEQIANKIAYQFIEGNNNFSVKNAINIKETMLDRKLTMNQKVYRDTMDELGRMCKRLEAISKNDDFTGQIQASLAMSAVSGIDGQSGKSALQMIDSQADVFAFDGVVQALVQITDYLGPDKQVDQLLKAVDLNNPSEFYANMARNGRCLRQARVFVNSASNILDLINQALLSNSLIVANSNSIHDVKYQDEQGNWRSIDVTQALTTYRNILTAVKSELNNLESAYFARFCEDIYGNKYITTTVGKLWKDIWNGQQALGEKTISIEDAVKGEGIDDIDVFHRYLGSMANNPDIIGQIVDKLMKTANKTADDLTLRYRDRLMILKQRSKDLGLDLNDLVERDENGVPTGNMITPPAEPTQTGNEEDDFIYNAYMKDLNEVPAVHYGSWEKARDEFKKQAWEDFKAENPDWEGMSGFARGYKWDEYLRPKMKQWNKQNSIKVEVLDENGEIKYIKWVPNKIYESSQWEELKKKYPNRTSNNDSLERWIKDYRQIKNELDSMLPVGSTTSYRLPQFRGTFMNSVRNQMNMEGGAFKRANAFRKTFGRRVVLESFIETSEDYDYGSLNTMNSPEEELLGTKLNYEEERTERLPLFGINKLENMQDLSSDLCGSMVAYASMATSYQCLDNVVDALEVGRQALYNRNIRGKDNFADKAGRIMSGKLGYTSRNPSGNDEAYLEGSKNRAYGRYIKFLDNQVYGVTAKYWGIPIGKGKRLLFNKIMQNLTSLAGFSFLQGNILGGTVNTITGFNNIFKEAVTGDYFNAKDWAFAHKYYFSNFVPMWTSDFGRLSKQNKLSLFLEHMNTGSNNRDKLRSWHTTRSRINNFFREVGYLPYSSGDHYMQAMSYLAVAHGTKLYDANGSLTTNLWDAYQRTKNIDDEGNYESGNRLEFNRFCPLDAHEIASDNLNNKGIYLKKVERTTSNFEKWLVGQDEQFADEVYKKDHADEYNDYRDTFDHLSDEELMQAWSDKYKTLENILGKVESYLNSNSPLAGVPSFTPEEEKYLRINKIGTGNYADILQKVRDDIYHIIWTKADESAYMDKCREVNNRMHGIYNTQDKTAWHKNLFTNAYLAMKGWILGYIEMMYSNTHYSIALGKNVEGFMNTALKVPADVILGKILKDSNRLGVKDMLITMICPWSNRSKNAMLKAGFSEEQNFNARRMTASMMLMLLLFAIKLAAAPPDDEDDEDEVDPVLGMVYYLTTRALFDQMVFISPSETYTQSGQIMNMIPPGWDAFYDLFLKLPYEGIGAMVGDEEDSDFFYQRDDPNGRYVEGEAKFWNHVGRLIPYYKSIWAIENPYPAMENYMFGRKMNSR